MSGVKDHYVWGMRVTVFYQPGCRLNDEMRVRNTPVEITRGFVFTETEDVTLIDNNYFPVRRTVPWNV